MGQGLSHGRASLYQLRHIAIAKTGSVSRTEVVMPGLKKRRLMLLDKPRNTAQLMLSETTIRHERNRIEPEFGHLPVTLHVDMRWFSPV
jgi:hypothetical protein